MTPEPVSTTTGAADPVPDQDQIEQLSAAAAAMLDPLTADASSPAGGREQQAALQQTLGRCAQAAREAGLPQFAALTDQVAASMTSSESQPDSQALEQWIELAIAFCLGRLTGEAVNPLLEDAARMLSDGTAQSGSEPAADLAGLQDEARRVALACEQSELSAREEPPEIGSDEMDMLAQACAELGEELKGLEHAAPHQVYSLIGERAGYFANAMRYMGLEPLANLFEHLIGRLQSGVDSGSVLDDAHHDALMAWPGCWAAWFARRRPEQLDRALALHELPLWHAPHLLAYARASLGRLQLVGSRRIEQLPEAVQPGDLSLEIPDDADPEVVDNLLRELPGLAAEFTDSVTEVAAGNADQMGRARRVAHTIKGAANTVGVVGVANLTHAVEDLLQLLEQMSASPEHKVIDTLCEASDCLSEMVDFLSGLAPEPAQSLPLYRQVLSTVNRLADDLEDRFQQQLTELDQQAGPELDEDEELGPLEPVSDVAPDGRMPMPEISLADFDLPELELGPSAGATDEPAAPEAASTAVPPAEVSEPTPPRDDADFNFDVPVLGQSGDSAATWMGWTGRERQSTGSGDGLGSEPAMGHADEAAFGSDSLESSSDVGDSRQHGAMLRVPAPIVERLLESADEAVVSVSELQDIVKDIQASHRSLRDGSERLDALSVELDRLIDAGPALSEVAADGAGTGEMDPLELERFTEIHTVSRRITEAAADSKLIEQQIDHHVERATSVVDKLERVQSLVRDGALRARMVDAGSIAARLQRAARQAARASDKNVRLTVVGGETAVDGETLQRLVDSLAHLVRNAVDHGIEDASGRKLANKPGQGEITVTFEREVSAISIVVEDDGAGLDLAAIERRARTLGLIPTDAEMDSRAAGQLILAPGFTTRIRPTQLSGRGIGLDVVNQTVRGLRGVIALQSEPGAGTRFELTLPLQLTSLSAFILRSDTHVVALSARGIDSILADIGAIESGEDGLRLAWQDRKLEVRRLDEVLGLPAGMIGSPPNESRAGDVVLVVRLPAGEPVAVLIPEPGQAREVVVRSLPDYMPRLAGIDGVTVLGDGAVAAVIDMPEMLAATAGARPDPRRLGRVSQPMPVCLVVDDSVSVRRAMAHFMLDLGLYCDAAADGHQALQIVAKRVPDLVVIDLEMPRMNGIELAQELRRAPATRDVPIVMITSRHSEKHRAMATAAGVNVFMTKPYTEDDLASVVGTCLAG